MKKLIYIFVLLFSGCIVDNIPPEPDIEHFTTFLNSTNHSISIERYHKGEMFHVIKLLYNGANWSLYNNILESEVPFFPGIADSVEVIFDDSISVWHRENDNANEYRNMLHLESYAGGKVNGELYEIFYEFTDADYEEAVLINEGG